MENINNHCHDGECCCHSNNASKNDSCSQEKDKHQHSGCHCGEAKEKEESQLSVALMLSRLFVAAALTAVASFVSMPEYISVILFGTAYLLAGINVIINAFKRILDREIFDENFLMVIATVGAFAISEYSEAVAVMIFFGIGELLQDIAVGRSRKSISALMDIRPDYANVLRDGKVVTVNPNEVLKGEVIVVKPGEKIPLDGIVKTGISAIDTSALTGEALPMEVTAGVEVLSGCVNKNGVIEIEVTAEFSASTVSKILALIENSSDKKAKSEQLITKFARIYTPVVVGIALCVIFIPPMLFGFDTFSRWLYSGLTFLIISCPCALVVSIPISFFAGIGGASRQGILIKGGNYLEALVNAETVVFDKTGTITLGKFCVTDIIPAENITKEKLLALAALAESGSNHPIALSIINEFGKTADTSNIVGYNEEAGFGVSCITTDGSLIAGKYELLLKNNIQADKLQNAGTAVYVALNGSYMGAVVISDKIKETSAEALKGLKALGIRQTVMLTGDNEENAKAVAEAVGIDKYSAGLLPADKVCYLEKIIEETQPGKKVIFVGDGINDAPVLARADIGVAMGGIGSDAAIEAADIVLMTDDPKKLCIALKIAAKTRRIVLQNIVFSLSVKAAILLLSLLGIASMWFAVFADVGVALLAVLNALRAMKKIKE